MCVCVCVFFVCVRERVRPSGKPTELQCPEEDIKSHHGDLAGVLPLSKRSTRLDHTGWSHTKKYCFGGTPGTYAFPYRTRFGAQDSHSCEPRLLVHHLSTTTCSTAVHEAKACSDKNENKKHLQLKRSFGIFVWVRANILWHAHVVEKEWVSVCVCV